MSGTPDTTTPAVTEEDRAKATKCAHRWDRWRTVVPAFDFAGRFVSASIAELNAADPVTPGWTRRCGLCGTLQIAQDVAERGKADALRAAMHALAEEWEASRPSTTTDFLHGAERRAASLARRRGAAQLRAIVDGQR